MLRHADIWQAIDRLARRNGFSASGLARRAGLDPTTFNPSKRQSAGGKLRWPSTESVSKILAATDTELSDFVTLIDTGSDGPMRRIPVLGYAQAGAEGFFDDAGFPVGEGWDEVMFPDVGDRHAYALEITGDSMVPVYRDGDIIIVAPGASIRRGDRVVVRTGGGEVMAKELARETAGKITLRSFNQEHEDRTLDKKDVDWIARILWASQ
ncbi:MAG: helix-turn-helix transcriptional regulator [Pseudomonadota bacterium]